MEKSYKHIRIFESEDTFEDRPFYHIENIKHGDNLGVLYYEKGWKQYVFSPASETLIFSVSCMLDIIDFIENEIKL